MEGAEDYKDGDMLTGTATVTVKKLNCATIILNRNWQCEWGPNFNARVGNYVFDKVSREMQDGYQPEYIGGLFEVDNIVVDGRVEDIIDTTNVSYNLVKIDISPDFTEESEEPEEEKGVFSVLLSYIWPW